MLPRAPWLRTLPPCWGVFRCYHVSCDPQRATYLKNKERFSCNDMQQGSRVFKTRSRVTETPIRHAGRRRCHDLQSMWIDATVQHYASDRSWVRLTEAMTRHDVATLQTARHVARPMGRGAPCAARTIISLC
jgi:hypothetical protein